MPWISQAIASGILVLLTLAIQSAGIAGFVLWARAFFAPHTSRLGLVCCARLMVQVTSVMFVLQLLEVALWAGFYRWKCFSAWGSALYFSMTSYSTVGYGDVLLPNAWRILGPIESVAGVLMCGLSTSVLFAIVVFLVRHEERFSPVKPFPSDPQEASAQTANGFAR